MFLCICLRTLSIVHRYCTAITDGKIASSSRSTRSSSSRTYARDGSFCAKGAATEPKYKSTEAGVLCVILFLHRADDAVLLMIGIQLTVQQSMYRRTARAECNRGSNTRTRKKQRSYKLTAIWL